MNVCKEFTRIKGETAQLPWRVDAASLPDTFYLFSSLITFVLLTMMMSLNGLVLTGT